jgi:hypothetical protein
MSKFAFSKTEETADMINLREVVTKSDLKQFINLVYLIYNGNSFWVPPIRKDEFNHLLPECNPSFKTCSTKFWTAWDGKHCVGRIGAIVNNESVEKIGRITRVEFVDNAEVSHKLFEAAEDWLISEGMTTVNGPLGFTNLDNQGLLIEGFDHISSIASVYHHPYYQTHFEQAGYVKENDWIEFRLTLGEKAFEKASRGAGIVKQRYGFEVKRFDSVKELSECALPVFHLMNKAFKDLPYVCPLSDEMIRYITRKYFKVLDPRFVRIITRGEEFIAFIICIPSLSKAMQKANGKLFPFGVFHIMKALKNPEAIDLLLTGVSPDYHTSGAAVILFAEIQAEMMKHGITQMETTGIFETNHNVISNWKNYEHIQHKRRRCYTKKLF